MGRNVMQLCSSTYHQNLKYTSLKSILSHVSICALIKERYYGGKWYQISYMCFFRSPLFHNLRQLVEPVTRLGNRVHPIPEVRKGNSVNSLFTCDIKIR